MSRTSPQHTRVEEEPFGTSLGGTGANRAWRIWVSRHPFASAISAGLIAGEIATLAGIWFFGAGLPSLNWAEINGGPIDPKGSLVTKFLIGGAFNVADSAIFALIFALFVFPYVGRIVNPLANLLKCIAYSMVLATIAAGFLFPYVYFKGYHVGFGGIHLGGWKFVLAIYLWHLIWGVVLGLLYSPMRASDPRLQQASE